MDLAYTLMALRVGLEICGRPFPFFPSVRGHKWVMDKRKHAVAYGPVLLSSLPLFLRPESISTAIAL